MKYWTLHRWVRSLKPKPKSCVICKIAPPVDIANISGNYKQDINDFEWLCRKCHMTKDGRSKQFAFMSSHKGTNHSLSRLSEDDIKAIRGLREIGNLHTHIANRFGITPQHVSRICSGVAWKHIGKVRP